MFDKRSYHLQGKGFPAMRLRIIGIFLCLSFVLQAQEIRGIVIDKQTEEPLVGANVYIKGTTTGTTTDLDGFFNFSYDLREDVLLMVRYMGYKPYTKLISASKQFNRIRIKLQKDIFQGDEVVVTGIANSRAKSVAEVAVSRVTAAELTTKNNYASVDQILNGKLSGVQLKSSSGNVGSGFRFIMRSGGGLNGNGQPVIYIDGVRIDNTQLDGFGAGGQGISILSTLSPADIADIEILKGPAAASSYGTDGSNGVVLITTQKGNFIEGKGNKLAISYKSVIGSNNQSYQYKPGDFLSAKDANAMFRSGAIYQNGLNISGGSQVLKYFTSFEKRFEEAHIPNNSQERSNFRLNLDAFPSEKLHFSVTTGFSSSLAARPQNDNNILGWLGNTLIRPRSYLFADSLGIANIEDKWDMNRFIGSLEASYTPTKQLEAKFNLGLDHSDTRQTQTFPANFYYSGIKNGNRAIWNRLNTQLTTNLNLIYSYQLFNNIKAKSIMGSQLFEKKLKTNFIEVENFLTQLTPGAGAGADFIDKGENSRHSKTAGLFTDHSFNYENKYFMTLGLRHDYASSISKQSMDVFYPHLSFAARLENQNYIPDMFNMFKVRMAYGETGRLPELTDIIDLLWEAELGAYGGGGVLAQIGNMGLKPERIREFELGADMEFLNNYSFELTYYLQLAKDAQIEYLNPPSTGKTASGVPFNVGSILGTGIETLLQAHPFRNRSMQLTFSLNNSLQTNRVRDLGKAQPIYDGFDIQVIKEGLPKHEFYRQIVTGPRFNSQGEYIGPNLSSTRTALGNPVPKYSGSLSMNLALFQRLNFYLLTDWAMGQKIYNNTKRFSTLFGNNPDYNRLAYQLGLQGNRPAGENHLSRLTPGSGPYKEAAEQIARLDPRVPANFIEPGDYLKLREISVNCSLKKLLPHLRIHNALKDITVGFSARNLMTLSKYSGADPEINSGGARSLIRGQDFLTLQNPRVYSIYTQISF